MKRTITFFAFYFFHFSLYAQQPVTYNSSDIYLQLQKLNVLGCVLYIAAHPDDENTRLLAFFSKEKMYRTGYLSLTRGDGGQNLIGNEQGIDLGLIRTQELLSARRIDGAEQFFSRAYDFGYSKSAEEAMRIWDKEKILSDVVWVIRKFQPDVIITRFPGDERAGHGHHAASSLLANEAFTAAADPLKFPEQFKYGVQPWQAKRILWNTFNFGSTNTTAEDQFKMDVGAFNPLVGKGYGEIAAESRSQHKSQGFGVPRQRGIAIEYFKTTGGVAPQKALLDSVSTDWSRVDGGAAVKVSINGIIAGYSFEHPENSVKALVNLYKLISAKSGYWPSVKAKEVMQLIEACSGLYAEAVTSQARFAPGDSLTVSLIVNKRNNTDISLKSITVSATNSYAPFAIANNNTNRLLPLNENVSVLVNALLNDSLQPTQPYWLQYPMSTGSFNVINQNLIGKAESDPAFTATYTFNIEGTDFDVVRPVQNKFTDPVKGELFQPVVVQPKFLVQHEPPLVVSSLQNNASIKMKYTAKTSTSGQVKNQNNNGVADDHMAAKGANNLSGKSENFATNITPIMSKNNLIRDTMLAANHKPAVFPVSIQYDHIPNIIYYKPVVKTTLQLDVKTIGKNIGYINGAGDKVAQALEQMGYTVTHLTEADIASANLQKFDAVLTGVRAYNTNAFLKNKNNELMDYVRNGGNFIVQYNVSGNNLPAFGPYPFNLSRNRITDETAKVDFVLPNHPVLNYPNKITAKDFEGWIQERSIYEAVSLDSNYAAPLAMADPGEKPSNGSLIIAKYGKGNFVYTGLVFFREMPAGVAGSYRLMANLIALPKKANND